MEEGGEVRAPPEDCEEEWEELFLLGSSRAWKSGSVGRIKIKNFYIFDLVYYYDNYITSSLSFRASTNVQPIAG